MRKAVRAVCVLAAGAGLFASGCGNPPPPILTAAERLPDSHEKLAAYRFTLEVDPANRPVLAYVTSTGLATKVVRFEGGVWNPLGVLSVTSAFAVPTIVFNSSGNPLISGIAGETELSP